MTELIAKTDMIYGTMLTTEDGYVFPQPLFDSSNYIFIGICTRAMKQGEVLKYMPNGNTKDIVINSEGWKLNQ